MSAAAPTALHVFSTCEAGGAQIRACSLLAHLGPLDHVVVSLDGGRHDPRLLPGGEAWRASLSLPKMGSARTVRALRSVLWTWRPALVLTYDWGALDGILANALSMRAGLVHHEDGVAADEARAPKRRRTWARRVALRWADRVVVPSRALEAIALDAWGLTPGRLARIPNGVDVTRFAPRRSTLMRERLGIPPGAGIVGMVCRLAAIKNLPRAVRALADVSVRPPPHLIVAGEGPERGAIETAARALGITDRVHLLGHVLDTTAVYGELDAFLVTSDREELPVALLEAMASGLAVVATDVGDVPNALPSSARSFLAPVAGARVEEALAAALTRLLSDSRLRAEIGRANRARVLEAYDAVRMRRRYRTLYEDVLAGRVS